MLFILDNTLLNIKADSNVHVSSLENLLNAYQNRFHLLFAKLSDIKKLQEIISPSLSLSGRKILNSLYNQLPGYKAVADSVGHRVTVVLGTGATVVRDGENWIVPLEYFKEGLLQSTILGEDDRDAELYLLLSEHYRAETNINGFQSRARLRGGGGSGIARSLTAYISGEQSPCICITDSDKLHPRFRASPTSRSCSTIAGSVSKIVKHYSIEEREVENLLPLDVLAKAVNGKCDFPSSIQAIKGYHDEMWRYLDLKTGIALRWIKSKDEVTQEYWRCVGEHLERRRQSCVTCDNRNACDTCSYTALRGFGDKILEKSISCLNENSLKINLRMMRDDTRWKTLGKIVFDYSIAPQGELSRY